MSISEWSIEKFGNEPTFASVTIEEIKLFARVDIPDEDEYLSEIAIPAAEEYVEAALRRFLKRRTVRLHLENFRNRILLPYPPIASVDAVKYYSEGDVLTTLPSAYYTTHLIGDRPFIERKYEYSWPTLSLNRSMAVQVEYTAGWAENEIPKAVKQAICLLANDYYVHREARIEARIGQGIRDNPAVERLLLTHICGQGTF